MAVPLNPLNCHPVPGNSVAKSVAISYVSPMANKPEQPDQSWRIYLKATPAKTIGYVDAPDAETAIAVAIEEFKIDPRIAQRLMAERQD